MYYHQLVSIAIEVHHHHQMFKNWIGVVVSLEEEEEVRAIVIQVGDTIKQQFYGIEIKKWSRRFDPTTQSLIVPPE